MDSIACELVCIFSGIKPRKTRVLHEVRNYSV